MHIGKGQLHGLDLQVLRSRAIHGQAGQVKVLQHAQRHQCGQALPAGWNLVQHAPVGLRQRRDPLGPVRRQVGLREGAALLRRKPRQGLGDLAGVERLARVAPMARKARAAAGKQKRSPTCGAAPRA